MVWARMLAYVPGTVDQELLLRNEYLVTENRILRAIIQTAPLPKMAIARQRYAPRGRMVRGGIHGPQGNNSFAES
jgi:hypothetical protein